MLKKPQRISDNKDFQTIYRRGRHFSNAFFSLNYLKNPLGKSRVGLVVNKKVAREATKRNLLKRRLRETMREFYPTITAGQDIIISARPKAIELSFEALQKELTQLLVSANLLSKNN